MSSLKPLPSPKRGYLDSVANRRKFNLGPSTEVGPHAARIAAAWQNSADFAEFVLHDEQTGRPVIPAPFHREWHGMFEANKRSVLFASVEHAKTSHVLMRVLWVLGKNPNARIALVSNTATQAEKLLSAIKRNIESNHRLHQVFPKLRRGTSPQWSHWAITIDRPAMSKDPSVQAIGVGGPINGSRVDLMILDDVCDFENTRNPSQRKTLVDWWDTTASTRVTKDGRTIVIGTPWHEEDLLHELAKRSGFATARYPAVLNSLDPREHWQPLWPASFPLERILDISANTTAHAFARKYLCEVRNDETSRFQGAWWDQMVKAGQGWPTYFQGPPRTPSGDLWPCFTGIDLAVGQSEGHDLTAFVTIGFEPNSRKRTLLEVKTGRWDAPEIIARIKDTYRRFNSIMVVESNAAQAYIKQFAQGEGVPIRPYTTNASNKYNEHFGVESVAVEMASGLWRVPSGQTGADIAPESVALWRECLQYSPDTHTGDRLMALWFAREAARNYAPSVFGTHTLQNR